MQLRSPIDEGYFTISGECEVQLNQDEMQQLLDAALEVDSNVNRVLAYKNTRQKNKITIHVIYDGGYDITLLIDEIEYSDYVRGLAFRTFKENFVKALRAHLSNIDFVEEIKKIRTSKRRFN